MRFPKAAKAAKILLNPLTTQGKEKNLAIFVNETPAMVFAGRQLNEFAINDCRIFQTMALAVVERCPDTAYSN